MPTIGEVYNDALRIAKEKDLLSADIRILIAFDEGLHEQIDVIYDKDKEMRNPLIFAEQMKLLERANRSNISSRRHDSLIESYSSTHAF